MYIKSALQLLFIINYLQTYCKRIVYILKLEQYIAVHSNTYVYVIFYLKM